MKGRVIKSTGSWYQVLLASGEVVDSRIRGKFKLENKKITNPIAVGDWVELDQEHTTPEEYVIATIHPRTNYIIRRAPKKMAYGHILASNIDLAVLVASVVMPKTSTGFIDRFLVSAEAYRIPAMIIFNKSDLWDDESRKQVEQLAHSYEKIGYDTLIVSALNISDIKLLKGKLKDKTSLLSGHSGVGKSTLLNNLVKKDLQKTSAVSAFADKGVHTTTFAEMFIVDKTTFIIDTPGIKELALAEVEPDELSHYFPEMRAIIGTCKYHNCTHSHEPGCAILEALKSGSISPSRYISYISMLENEDNRR